MSAQKLVLKALTIRDSSLAEVEPEVLLGPLPKRASTNVCSIANDILTLEEIRITSYDAPELLEAIQKKELSCVEVTRAFLRRAALAQKLVNCITELLPQSALERAAYLDSLDHPVGPLHGLPISIKEQHGMAGLTTHASYITFIGQPQISPTRVNEVLLEAGAIFYARTTQPQCVMHLETSSNIYGTTLNPHNITLTAGGSSGGESALIAMRGSILGVGGDIGGSIRSPAANTGIYGFKPTPGRLSKVGAKVAFGGQEGIPPTQGPLSTSLSGINLFMKSYLHYQPWIKDDSLVPIPWRAVTLPPRLKIAVMWSDGVVTPHPPVTRALKDIVEIISGSEIDIVDWIPEGHGECWNITHSLYFEDGGRAVEKILKDGNDDMLPLTKWLLQDSGNVKYQSVEEVCALKLRRNDYRARYNELWLNTGKEDDHPVDAILCPVGPGAAPPHGNAKYWSYTSQWNMLEYPAVAFPVTTVNQQLDIKDTAFRALNAQDQFNHDLYEPSKYLDAPVGLQLVTRRFEDEKCLAILDFIEKALGRR